MFAFCLKFPYTPIPDKDAVAKHHGKEQKISQKML